MPLSTAEPLRNVVRMPDPRTPVTREPRPVGDAAGPLRDLRRPIIAGLAVLVLVFAVGGGWAAVAPLAGAVIAPGVISPEGSRQTVQHLEGGIIRAILVRDSDVVAKGQPLVVLEGVGARAEVGRIEERLRTLAAQEARLRAERLAPRRSDSTMRSWPTPRRRRWPRCAGRR